MTEWWALTFHPVMLTPPGSAILLLCLLGHILINPIPSNVPPSFLQELRWPDSEAVASVSGVTALVKDPEAELIIVIKASYLHNTSQAEGTQCFSRAVYRKLSSSTLPCCCFPGDPDRGLQVAYIPITLNHPRCRELGSTPGGHEHQPVLQKIWKASSFQGPANPQPEPAHYHVIKLISTNECFTI